MASFLCLAPAWAAQNQPRLYTELSSRNYSDPTSIQSFIHKLDGQLESGDHAFTYSQFQTGVVIDRFRIGLVGRFDYFFKFTPDSARFYRDLEHEVGVDGDESYDLSLKVNHLRATGLKVGYDWVLQPGLVLNTDFSYLTANAFLDGKLWGSAHRRSVDNFDVNANTSFHSDHDVYLEYDMLPPRGRGYSLDFGMDWRITPDWLLSVHFNDLYSRLKWGDALISELDLSTDISRFDQDGNFHVRPFLKGKQRLASISHKLPTKLIGELSYKVSTEIRLFSELFHTNYFDHYKVGVAFDVGVEQLFQVGWHIQAQALEIGYYTSYGYIQFAADSLDKSQAKAMTLNVGFSIPF